MQVQHIISINKEAEYDILKEDVKNKVNWYVNSFSNYTGLILNQWMRHVKKVRPAIFLRSFKMLLWEEF